MDERAQYEIDQTTQREAAYRRQIERVRNEVHAQRRYEIARDVLAGFAANMSAADVQFHVGLAVDAADALLAELKGGK